MNRLSHAFLPKTKQMCCGFRKCLSERRWHYSQAVETSSSSSLSSSKPSSSSECSSSTEKEIKPLSLDELEKIAVLMENDPRILLEVIAQLEPQVRRRLIVAGGAMEWFGKENAAKEVEKADIDNDRTISPKDFDHWFIGALKQRMEEQRRRDTGSVLVNKSDLCSSTSDSVVESTNARERNSGASSENPSVHDQNKESKSVTEHDNSKNVTHNSTPLQLSSSSPSSSSPLTLSLPATATATATATTVSTDASYVPMSSLLIVAIEAGLPFVGFGLFDNATMLLAGDAIDSSVGFYLNCSVLASAAMGNVCSGMFGMQVHGLIDRAVQKLFHRLPTLTESQLKNKRVFLAGQLGGTLGILLGLILGMFPLLFIDADTNTKSDYAMFQRWDVGCSGFIELPELEQVLAELGLGDTHNVAKRVVNKYGKDNKLSYQEYKRLKNDLRKGKPIFE